MSFHIVCAFLSIILTSSLACSTVTLVCSQWKWNYQPLSLSRDQLPLANVPTKVKLAKLASQQQQLCAAATTFTGGGTTPLKGVVCLKLKRFFHVKIFVRAGLK